MRRSGLTGRRLAECASKSELVPQPKRDPDPIPAPDQGKSALLFVWKCVVHNICLCSCVSAPRFCATIVPWPIHSASTAGSISATTSPPAPTAALPPTTNAGVSDQRYSAASAGLSFCSLSPASFSFSGCRANPHLSPGGQRLRRNRVKWNGNVQNQSKTDSGVVFPCAGGGAKGASGKRSVTAISRPGGWPPIKGLSSLHSGACARDPAAKCGLSPQVS